MPLPALAEGFPGEGSRSDWGDAIPYYNQANRYLAAQRYDDAARRYNDAIAIYKFDPDFYINLGVAYRKLGDFPNAELALKSALKLNDKDWMPWSDLANIYLKQDKLQEAVKTFQRTLKCSPPAAEKAAILQDIKDINKILAMQQPPPVKPDEHVGGATSKAGASKKSTSSSATTQRGKPAAREAIGSASAKSDTTPAANTKQNLQGTGWDYVYPNSK